MLPFIISRDALSSTARLACAPNIADDAILYYSLLSFHRSLLSFGEHSAALKSNELWVTSIFKLFENHHTNSINNHTNEMHHDLFLSYLV
jgi:hypothetical protein